MRRLIPAAIMLISVILIYSFSYFYINDVCDNTKQMLKECEIAYETQNNCQAAAKEIKSYWEQKEKKLSFIVNHGLIDDIELTVSAINLYSSTKDNIIFYEYSDRLRTLIHQLTEETNFSTVNIF